MFDVGADLQRAFDVGYKCGRLDALTELLNYIGEMGDYETEQTEMPQYAEWKTAFNAMTDCAWKGEQK